MKNYKNNFKKLNLLGLSLLFITGCNNQNNEEIYPSFIEEINSGIEFNAYEEKESILGKPINDIEVFSDSKMYDPNNLINDSGMSGNDGINHLHSNLNPKENMYLSKSNQDNYDLIFKFASPKSLGRIYIYNFNFEGKKEVSLKEFKIEYSSDGYHYNEFNNGHIYQIEENTYSSSSSFNKIDDEDYLDLKGINARYIKLIPISNYGGLNNQYGLSEIRFFEHKEEIKEDSSLPLSLIGLKKEEVDPGFNKLLNNNGISSINDINKAKHTNNPYYAFASNNSSFTLSLNGNYPLSKIAIWNYNDKNNLDYGIKELKILTSVDGDNFNSLGIFEINKASGNDEEKVSTIIELKDNIRAQYVRFEYLSNYDGELKGLSEIKILAAKGYQVNEEYELNGYFSSYNGWTGSDGIFNVSLDGDQSIKNREKYNLQFHFSDTYIGKVNPITKHRIQEKFLNNSFGIYNGENIEFKYDENAIHITPIKDLDRSSSDAWYWLGDSFIVNNKYYINLLYMAKEGPLGFRQKGNDLGVFDIKDQKVDFSSFRIIKDEEDNKLSYIDKDPTQEIIFGSAIYENTISANAFNPDGYIYNYGYRDDKKTFKRESVVCRVKENEVEDLSSYEYYSALGWVKDISKVKPLINNVSCEMSLTHINNKNSEYFDKYLLTFQYLTNSNEIKIAVGDSLNGPFNESIIIYDTPETIQLDNVNQYNAKMHPTLSSLDKYIISYNVNEAKGGINQTNGDLYRPRFISISEIK